MKMLSKLDDKLFYDTIDIDLCFDEDDEAAHIESIVD